MYIDADIIIKAGSLITALTILGTLAYKAIKWFQAQEKQTKDIEALKQQEKADIEAIRSEQCLLTYGILACLKGLQEQGCDGPVKEAVTKIEKHLNQQAHGQKAN